MFGAGVVLYEYIRRLYPKTWYLYAEVTQFSPYTIANHRGNTYGQNVNATERSMHVQQKLRSTLCVKWKCSSVLWIHSGYLFCSQFTRSNKFHSVNSFFCTTSLHFDCDLTYTKVLFCDEVWFSEMKLSVAKPSLVIIAN